MRCRNCGTDFERSAGECPWCGTRPLFGGKKKKEKDPWEKKDTWGSKSDPWDSSSKWFESGHKKDDCGNDAHQNMRENQESCANDVHQNMGVRHAAEPKASVKSDMRQTVRTTKNDVVRPRIMSDDERRRKEQMYRSRHGQYETQSVSAKGTDICGLAVVGFVIGLISLFWNFGILGIVGIIVNKKAKRKIRETEQGGKFFANLGSVFSWLSTICFFALILIVVLVLIASAGGVI